MLEFEGMVHTMIGMPLSFVGAVTTSLKFIGILNRYVADQTSNVQNEVVSKTMAATKEGMRGSVCPHCGKLVEEGSRFCDNCGKLLTYLCTSYGEENGADAKFCKSCGDPIKHYFFLLCVKDKRYCNKMQ